MFISSLAVIWLEFQFRHFTSGESSKGRGPAENSTPSSSLVLVAMQHRRYSRKLNFLAWGAVARVPYDCASIRPMIEVKAKILYWLGSRWPGDLVQAA